MGTIQEDCLMTEELQHFQNIILATVPKLFKMSKETLLLTLWYDFTREGVYCREFESKYLFQSEILEFICKTHEAWQYI
jgi:hypothetical protein